MRGQKIDLVGFDACLMSCMELAGVLADSVGYLLASEELEPGNGWQYHWLGALFREGIPADDVTAVDHGKAVIDLYPTDFSTHDVQPDGVSLYRSEGGCDGTDNIWNYAEESTLALTDFGKIDGLIEDFDEMAAAMNAIVRGEAFSDHIADLGYAISRSAGSQNLDNLLDVYEYAESIMALYTDADSNLYQHQSMHEECQALFCAAGKVSDYFTFDDEETNAASEDNSGALLSGTGDNPVLYRGKGAQAARGGISVFGPVEQPIGR